MSPPPPNTANPADASVELPEGWHCSHMFYRFDRRVLATISAADIQRGRDEVVDTLTPEEADAPARMQTWVVSGQKADFALMLMDANPLRIDAVHQRLMSGRLGPALTPCYSFVSVTEVSEYVPTVEQYAERLAQDGQQRDSPASQAKIKAYANREPLMRRQRLTPDFPPWPVACFYPMNKKRKFPENWFLLPFSKRNSLMAEHARSGMEFAGKVSQLITVAVGLDDWEWGVTLWGRNPQFLKEIVYRMRFDEAGARYAEFGPFYTGYVLTAGEMLDHCRVGQDRA